MRVQLKPAEALALQDVRGLPEAAHLLVMCMSSDWVLEGSRASFDLLVDAISEDLADGMHAAETSRLLADICLEIDPTRADWLEL